MVFMKKILLILILLFLVGNCGTFFTIQHLDYNANKKFWNSRISGAPVIYSGTRFDGYYLLVSVWAVSPLAIPLFMDLPLCVVADTLLLPLTIPIHYQHKSIRQKDRFTVKELLYASRTGDIENVRFFIQTADHKLDINSVDEFGTSSLMEATRQGELETVMFLMEHGANVNSKDFSGNTALHFPENLSTVYPGDNDSYVKIIEYLIRRKADITIRNNDGKTAVDLAYEGGNKERIAAFRK